MRSYSALWFPVLLAILLQGLFVVQGVVPVAEGGLYDPDAFMRLVRVGEFAESGDWFDAKSMRSNAPFGEELHWTRPLDVLLLAGAAVLAPLTGFPAALHWWGVALSPVLQLLALVAMFWAGRDLFDVRGRVFLAVIFLCQAGLFNAFMVGRPDHHSLLALFFVVTVGLTLRLIGATASPRHGLVLGAVLALAMWVSAEALPPVALVLATLGIVWIYRGGAFADSSLAVGLTLAAGSALALLINPPGAGVLAPVYDRLSVVHVVIFALVGLFWVAVAALGERGPAAAAGARAVLTGAGAVVVVGLVWAIFPKLAGGPYVDVDPRVLPIYLDLVDEVRPLIHTGTAPLIEFLYWLGGAVLGLPYLVYRCFLGNKERREPWFFLLGAALLFVALAFYQLRWSSYAGLLLVFPVTGLLMATLGVLDRRLDLPWRALARALTVILFSVGFLLLGGLLKRESQSVVAVDAGGGAVCPLRQFAEFASGPAGAPTPQRILASVFAGPELLYHTPHQVVASPYHRNWPGIGDAHAIMTAADEGSALDLVRRREITWILLCPGPAERFLYRTGEKRPSFYDRLAAGQPPPWLQAVALPDELAGFRLFRVNR
jgi:hypothetical protein